MIIFVGFLIVSTLLCALVTGFIFTYAVVVMPAFAKLDDRDFIRAFQVTDGVIQNNQPHSCLPGLARSYPLLPL